eukprot:4163834-Prymnesium_polylepis.1
MRHDCGACLGQVGGSGGWCLEARGCGWVEAVAARAWAIVRQLRKRSHVAARASKTEAPQCSVSEQAAVQADSVARTSTRIGRSSTHMAACVRTGLMELLEWRRALLARGRGALGGGGGGDGGDGCGSGGRGADGGGGGGDGGGEGGEGGDGGEGGKGGGGGDEGGCGGGNGSSLAQ